MPDPECGTGQVLPELELAAPADDCPRPLALVRRLHRRRGATGRRCDRRRGRRHWTVARLLLRHPPGPVMHPDLSGTQVALVDLLDRLLAGGVVLSGDLIISIAGVDLVRVSLRALITSIEQELR